MKYELPVESHVADLVSKLQNAGYEAYIVGGAIRDLLLGRAPKDFDISTSATPEEIRSVFGRRSSRIIGRRFRLVHVQYNGELFEVSTFRRAPARHAGSVKKELPENLILSDNSFGTAEEDAWRRDFTVNALFFDPVHSELLDYTGRGIDDIRGRIVRAIGDARLRFEEDPVRMLRALKLIGQYGFTMDAATENALFSELALIRVASPSRLTLELEKILTGAYGDRHFLAFHDYGLLPYFLPELDSAWDTPHGEYARNLLSERNFRVLNGAYRNSISLAMAAIALPFVEFACGSRPGELWSPGPESESAIREVLDTLFRPQKMMIRMTMSAERVLLLQPLFQSETERSRLIAEKSYPHARELMLLRLLVAEMGTEEAEEQWPATHPRRQTSAPAGEYEGRGTRRSRSRRRRRGARKQTQKEA